VIEDNPDALNRRGEYRSGAGLARKPGLGQKYRIEATFHFEVKEFREQRGLKPTIVGEAMIRYSWSRPRARPDTRDRSALGGDATRWPPAGSGHPAQVDRHVAGVPKRLYKGGDKDNSGELARRANFREKLIATRQAGGREVTLSSAR